MLKAFKEYDKAVDNFKDVFNRAAIVFGNTELKKEHLCYKRNDFGEYVKLNLVYSR